MTIHEGHLPISVQIASLMYGGLAHAGRCFTFRPSTIGNIVNSSIALQLNHTHLGGAAVGGSARVFTRLDIFVLNSGLERYCSR